MQTQKKSEVVSSLQVHQSTEIWDCEDIPLYCWTRAAHAHWTLTQKPKPYSPKRIVL